MKAHIGCLQTILSLQADIGRSPQMREPMALEWAWLFRDIAENPYWLLADSKFIM